MSHIGCTIKTLPQESQDLAASKAVEFNPANAPALHALKASMPGAVIQPQHLTALTTKYWGAKGVKLTVGFLDNPPADLRARIITHMNAWGSWSNVQFFETSVDPQVRIARTAGSGYWSYLGTDVLLIPPDEATMNLDSFTMNTADSEFYRVVRHETGHTLGFPHEHMRQEIISRIDQDKAIAYFGTTQGWSKQQVIDQVLTPLDSSALLATAEADIHSIMCYWLPASIMKDGVAVDGGADIDALDAQFAGTLYPRSVSPTSIWPNGKAYFFKGAQYDRYDPKADKVDPGYPKPIQGNWPGFPAGFEAGVNAAVVWGNGKVYFFKGSQYIRYDIVADKVDAGYPKPIKGNWPGLWADKIDAGVVWPNGKAYFFKGSKYIRYDIATDKADAGYPRAIQGSWPGFPSSFTTGINAAVVWDNGKAYFFKGSEYIRYDIANNKTDAGYPKPIKGNWPGLWEKNIDA
ncbi:MAG: hemopexin repeat-containing protein [Methylobacter sp.]|nr:hemopexin repeat-containing protein [Methylobacter sp.]